VKVSIIKVWEVAPRKKSVERDQHKHGEKITRTARRDSKKKVILKNASWGGVQRVVRKKRPGPRDTCAAIAGEGEC